ncbi:MAG: hypothetical protein II438_00580, partial [Clostridiales bacterium]|nr:hypothetical protein [Clostridiales bacterium]
MKKVAAVVLATAMTVPLITGCGAVTVPSESTAETTVKELGPARAQDDYYRFVNQDRFNTSEFKYGENSVEVAFKTDLIDEQIEKIIDDCAAGKGYAKGSEEDLIKYAYESFNSYDFDNTPIPADLMAAIDAVDNAKSVSELLEVDARIYKEYCTGGFFKLKPSVNPLNPKERIMVMDQLPGILNTSFEDIRDNTYSINNISKTGQTLLATRGYDKETAKEYANGLAKRALDIYGATDMEIVDDGMPFKYQKIMTSDEFKKTMSNIDMDKYL